MYFEYYEKWSNEWKLTKLKAWQGIIVLLMKVIKPQEYEFVRLAKVK